MWSIEAEARALDTTQLPIALPQRAAPVRHALALDRVTDLMKEHSLEFHTREGTAAGRRQIDPHPVTGTARHGPARRRQHEQLAVDDRADRLLGGLQGFPDPGLGRWLEQGRRGSIGGTGIGDQFPRQTEGVPKRRGRPHGRPELHSRLIGRRIVPEGVRERADVGRVVHDPAGGPALAGRGGRRQKAGHQQAGGRRDQGLSRRDRRRTGLLRCAAHRCPPPAGGQAACQARKAADWGKGRTRHRGRNRLSGKRLSFLCPARIRGGPRSSQRSWPLHQANRVQKEGRPRAICTWDGPSMRAGGGRPAASQRD
jgi:hypothetical protein